MSDEITAKATALHPDTKTFKAYSDLDSRTIPQFEIIEENWPKATKDHAKYMYDYLVAAVNKPNILPFYDTISVDVENIGTEEEFNSAIEHAKHFFNTRKDIGTLEFYYDKESDPPYVYVKELLKTRESPLYLKFAFKPNDFEIIDNTLPYIFQSDKLEPVEKEELLRVKKYVDDSIEDKKKEYDDDELSGIANDVKLEFEMTNPTLYFSSLDSLAKLIKVGTNLAYDRYYMTNQYYYKQVWPDIPTDDEYTNSATVQSYKSTIYRVDRNGN